MLLLLAFVAWPASPAASTVVAASCNGKSHAPPVLSAGSANPGAGLTSTTITFSVVYQDAANCPPSSIEVAIVGLGQVAMSGPGSGFDGGVTFVVSRTLPPGSWDYGFSVTSGSGAGEETVFLGQTSPNRVTITAPTPPPPPPPPPTPKPTPKPTPAPTSPPTPAPTSPPTAPPTTAPHITPPPGPTAPPTPRPTAPPTPGSTTVPTASATPVSIVPPSGDPGPSEASTAVPSSLDPGASPSPTDGVAVSGLLIGGMNSSGGPDDRDGRGGSGSGLGGPGTGFAPAIGHDSRPGTLAIGLISAVTAVMALGALGAAARRNRRAREEHRRGLVAAAGAVAAVAAVGPPPLPPPPVDSPPPWQTLTGRAPTKFDAGPKAGIERKTIGYRFVRVSDGPDDLRSREVGRLDRGDEVEVIGEHEGMLQVRTANGLMGWVPRVVIVS